MNAKKAKEALEFASEKLGYAANHDENSWMYDVMNKINEALHDDGKKKTIRILETCVYEVEVPSFVTAETCESYLEENDCWPKWGSPLFVKERTYHDNL